MILACIGLLLRLAGFLLIKYYKALHAVQEAVNRFSISDIKAMREAGSRMQEVDKDAKINQGPAAGTSAGNENPQA